MFTGQDEDDGKMLETQRIFITVKCCDRVTGTGAYDTEVEQVRLRGSDG